MGSLEPFSGYAVEKMVAKEMKNVEARRCRQGTRKTGLEGFYYQRVFRRDEVVACSASKKLGLTAAETLRQESVRNRAERFDAEQRAVIGSLLSRMKYYEAQPASCGTLLSSEGKRGPKRDRAGSSGSGRGAGSLRATKEVQHKGVGSATVL